MSSQESGPALGLTVNPSHTLLAAVSLMHVAALCSLGMLPLPLYWQILLILLVWGSGVSYWYRYWQPAVERIEWFDSQRIRLQQRTEIQEGRLVKIHCLYPWLVSFSVDQPGGKARTILLLRDQTSADTFRKLAVQLHLAHAEVADAA